jgi:succinate-semialdehyde dehydrogenase/glutarate-semialdehyde dehydrogenase
MAIVEPLESTSGARRFVVRSPATQERIGDVAVASPADVRAAVARARAAQPAWAAAGVDARARVMRRARKLLIAKQEHFIDVIVRETGRSRVETIMMEILAACDSLAYHAKIAKRVLADEVVPLHLMRNKKLVVVHRPLGVVGIITPWNGPFVLALNPSVQALMAGNAVVVKPSEVTPFSGRLVAELFREAGLPDDVLTVVEGDGETGAALVDAGVDKICFTGSVRTGRKVGEACGRNLTPCTLELGGKDPMIVCADADLDRAAGGAVFGAFMNTGQYCCSTERVYVVEAVADAFVDKVIDKVRALRQRKDGEFDLGPMIWPSQLAVLERHVKDARQKSARVLLGGRRNLALGDLFYEPTVITGVTHAMLVMQEETFGPILPIMTVKDEEEALRLANDSTYGLSANVWTRDEAKAMQLARRLESGSVCVNDCAVTYGALEAPFGGRKSSGVGQVNGATGLRGYCYATPVVLDRFGLDEEAIWYPYTADKGRFLQRLIRWVWGTPLGDLFG